jgi:hypothetical protein
VRSAFAPDGFVLRTILIVLPLLPLLLWPLAWKYFSFNIIVLVTYFAFWGPFGGSAVIAACAMSKWGREPRAWWTVTCLVAAAVFAIGLGWHLGAQQRFRQPLPFTHALYFGFQMAMFPLGSAGAARGMLRVFNSKVLAMEYALVAAVLMLVPVALTALPPGFQGIFP